MLEPGDRVIMVSGAARGIGEAVSRRLAADGYRLSLGARDLDAVSDAARSLDIGDRATAHRFEALDPDNNRAWVDDTVAAHGRIDGLVNNAGLLHQFGLDDLDEDALDAMWAVNVKAPARLTRLALPHLRSAGDGRVVNIASLSGKRVKGGFSPGYAMTKHAVMALTHATRQHGWADGVRATAICPSFVATEMIDGVDIGPEPAIDPDDIAHLVSTALALPGHASVAEMIVNCRLEDQV